MGLARGDVVAFDPDGDWRLVRSGGNVCLQFFSESALDREPDVCAAAFSSVGGTIENDRENVLRSPFLEPQGEGG